MTVIHGRSKFAFVLFALVVLVVVLASCSGGPKSPTEPGGKPPSQLVVTIIGTDPGGVNHTLAREGLASIGNSTLEADGDGRVTFPNLSAGNHLLSVGARFGYQSQTSTVSVSGLTQHEASIKAKNDGRWLKKATANGVLIESGVTLDHPVDLEFEVEAMLMEGYRISITISRGGEMRDLNGQSGMTVLRDGLYGSKIVSIWHKRYEPCLRVLSTRERLCDLDYTDTVEFWSSPIGGGVATLAQTVRFRINWKR